MHEEIFDKKTKNNLALLARTGIVKNFYLAGGTGLAITLGHRLSYDLDFFSPKIFDTRTLIARLQNIGKWKLEKKEWGTVHGIFNGTKVSFLHYPYPLLFPTKRFARIRVADPRDIGCMKIDAIATRGTKKDFIDLFFLVKIMALSRLLQLFAKKYRRIDYNMIHVLKSLTYFADARDSPLPTMLIPCLWQDVEKVLERETKASMR